MKTGKTWRAPALPEIPENVGPEIQPAHARPDLEPFRPMEMVPGSSLRTRHAGHKGRDAARVADAFDRMARQAGRRGGAEPFTPSQIAAGRRYAALAERLAAAGVMCSAIDGTPGGGGAGSYIDAVLADRERFSRARQAVGMGTALEVRRMRAPRPGQARRFNVPILAIVEGVCLEELTIAEILDRYGWARSADATRTAREALCAALDRLACRI
jgi:hypothetical protein